MGGALLNAVLLNMNNHGCIAVCGMISQYSRQKHEGVHNLVNVVQRRIRMQGFMIGDSFHLYPKFIEVMHPLIKQGNIVYVEDTSEVLENAPKALIGLLWKELWQAGGCRC